MAQHFCLLDPAEGYDDATKALCQKAAEGTWWKWASLSFASSPHTVGLFIRFLFIGSRL